MLIASLCAGLGGWESTQGSGQGSSHPGRAGSPQNASWREVPKAQERGSHWSTDSLLKPLPVCTQKYQSHVQGFHISPGTHSALHTEDGLSTMKQRNTSFPVLPNIPVLIKSTDKHNIGCFLSL